MKIDYIAAQSVQNGHISGESYNLELGLSKYDRSFTKTGGAPLKALDGTQVSVVFDRETTFQIATQLHTEKDISDILDMREFLDSVVAGETFHILDDEPSGNDSLILKAAFDDGLVGDWETANGQAIVPVNWPMASRALRMDAEDTFYLPYIPANVGDDIHLEAWLDGTDCDHPFGLDLVFYDGGKAVLSNLPLTELPANTGLTTHSGTLTAPASTGFFRLRVLNSAYVAGDIIDFSHIRAFIKPAPSSYVLVGESYSERRENNVYMRYSFKVRKL